MPSNLHILSIAPEDEGLRLDIFVSKKLNISRSEAKKIIEQKAVITSLNYALKSSTIVFKDLKLFYKPAVFHIDEEIMPKTSIPLIYENNDFLIINKPAGLAVHKTHAKDTQPTVAAWLIQNKFFTDDPHDDLRSGIVHRIDKDTSGLLILARNYTTQKIFISLFASRNIHKEYLACVMGIPPAQGTIDYKIIRNPFDPTRMTYSRSQGREACTHFTLLRSNNQMSLVSCRPITGRTHQLRVHFAALGHALVGDSTYGKSSPLIRRHALHAHKLAFAYEGATYQFNVPMPPDMDLLFKNCC